MISVNNMFVYKKAVRPGGKDQSLEVRRAEAWQELYEAPRQQSERVRGEMSILLRPHQVVRE